MDCIDEDILENLKLRLVEAIHLFAWQLYPVAGDIDDPEKTYRLINGYTASPFRPISYVSLLLDWTTFKTTLTLSWDSSAGHPAFFLRPGVLYPQVRTCAKRVRPRLGPSC